MCLVWRDQVGFFTTSVLGFAPVFSDCAAADRMTAALMQVHRYHNAELYGFVVMPEHIHMLSRMPEDLSGSEFMGRLKAATANWCLPLVTEEHHEQMRVDKDHKKRAFWQARFHSTPLPTEVMFRQKLDYIHDNPVRRSLADRPENYRWSSALFYFTEFRDLCDIATQPHFTSMWPAESLPLLAGALLSSPAEG